MNNAKENAVVDWGMDNGSYFKPDAYEIAKLEELQQNSTTKKKSRKRDDTVNQTVARSKTKTQTQSV
jgi:hypothetical protein